MENVSQILIIIGIVIRDIGLLVFGVAAGWLTMSVFQQPERQWQLQAVTLSALFILTGMLAAFTSAGGLGAFSMTCGVTVLALALRKSSAGKSRSQDTSTEK